MSETGEAQESKTVESELAKRLANQFIFSAVIAFVTFYRVEIYSVITKQDNWKDSLEKMQFWNWRYLLEIIIVIQIYLAAVVIGKLISHMKNMLVIYIENINKYIHLLTFTESYKLHREIEKLKKQVLKEQQIVKASEIKINDVKASFVSQLGFNGQNKVNFYFVSNGVASSRPFVYNEITKEYSDNNIFTNLSQGESIRFFTEFKLFDDTSLVYDFKGRINLASINLGHETLFKKLPFPINDTKALYFWETSSDWTQDASKSSNKYLKLVKDNNGFIKLSANFG